MIKQTIQWLLFGTALMLSAQLQAFNLTDFKGKKVDFDQMVQQDKWSLVVFWAHDCGVCRAEIPDLSKFHNARKDKNLQVIGISIDGQENIKAAKAFLKQTQPTFPSYLGEIELVAFNYELNTKEAFRGTPTFLLFAPGGELMANQAGKLRLEAIDRFIARYQAPAPTHKTDG